MKKVRQPLFLIGLVAIAAVARASDGRSEPCLIQGHVMDAVTKKPLSGVVVSVSAPGSTNPKEAVTDADGFFYFTQLPAAQCQFNLQFGKKGYQLYKRSYLLAKEKATLKINVEVLPEDPDNLPEDSEYPLLKMMNHG